MTKKDNKYYKKTIWKGLDNFECKNCEFSTLNRNEITQHIEKHIAGERSAQAATAKRAANNAEAEKFLEPTKPEDPVTQVPAGKKKKKK